MTPLHGGDVLYPKTFFDEHRDGALRSAQSVVPLLIEILKPTSVLDVGCGLGTWLAVFQKCGIDDVVGVDGAYVDAVALEIEPETFVSHDLSTPLRLERSFDLAVSLEVAEHLPAEAAATLVDSLALHAPAVLFSAAIPEQDGLNHVNTQWPTYWQALFAARGLELVDCIRPQIWSNEQVEFWYRQNALLFVRRELIDESPTLRAEVRIRRPIDLVHPAHWSQVTYQARLDRAEIARLSAELEQLRSLADLVPRPLRRTLRLVASRLRARARSG